MITLPDAKTYLRVEGTDHDALLNRLIKAARQHIEGPDALLNRVLVTQTWELVLDEFPLCEVQLPLAPVQSIQSVKYDDEDGVERTVDAADYEVDLVSTPSWVLAGVSGWPATMDAVNSVRIRFVAGYPPAAGSSPPDLLLNVPEPLRIGQLMLVSHWFEHRGVVSETNLPEVPHAVHALMERYRVYL